MPELDKIAIVTGANKGIGKAVAIGLARLNYKLILIGRDKTDLKKISEEIISESGLEPAIFSLDITESEMLSEIVRDIINRFKRIDILVNNAGIYFDGSIELQEESFRKMLDTNLTSQFVLLQEVVPIMKKQKSGYIFNVASRAGKIGFSGSGGYSASKFGMVGLNESLYRELTPLGIKVTALCPGWVNTKMAYEAGSKLHPEQMIQREDLFETIKWLLTLSPGACVKEIIIETPFSIS